MEAKRGTVFVEGINVIIKRDLDKHKSLLERDILNINHFQETRNSEIQRKKFYAEQKGKRNYDDAKMDEAILQMNKNIAHLSARIDITRKLKEQNTLIVDTLTKQLEQYYKDLVNFKK